MKNKLHYYLLLLLYIFSLFITGEALKKPTKVEDLVAKDKQGRRRFHGAFTGGFSAGYFNSVGTKEGKLE